jgi:hypothetical protein
MIALAEGQKTPAGSVPEGFRWDQNSHRTSGVHHAGHIRRFIRGGVREGNRPLAAWQGEVPTPSGAGTLTA